MHLIYLIFPLIFYSYHSTAQVQFKAFLVGTSSGKHIMADGNGNLVVNQDEGIFLLAPNGTKIRKITPPTNTFFLAGKNIVVTHQLDSPTEIYSLDHFLMKLSSIALEGNPLILKNGNVVILSINGDVRVYSLTGTLISQSKLPERAWFSSEFKDGSIAVSQKNGFAILDNDLKLVKLINIQGNLITNQNSELFAYGLLSGGLNFYNSKGEVKFTLPDIHVHDLKHLPNGKVAIMTSEGIIEFFDSEGVKSNSHNTGQSIWSPLALVDEKTLAYWKKSEIIFIDFEGKIKTSYKWPSKIIDEEIPRTLIGLGNGHVAAQYMTDSIKLIKIQPDNY